MALEFVVVSKIKCVLDECSKSKNIGHLQINKIVLLFLIE